MWKALDDDDPTVLLMADEIINAANMQPTVTMTLRSELWDSILEHHASMEAVLVGHNPDLLPMSIHTTAMIRLAVSDFMEDKDTVARVSDETPVTVTLPTRTLYGSFCAIVNGLSASEVPLECPPQSNGALAWEIVREMGLQMPAKVIDLTLYRFGLPDLSVLTEATE